MLVREIYIVTEILLKVALITITLLVILKEKRKWFTTYLV